MCIRDSRVPTGFLDRSGPHNYGREHVTARLTAALLCIATAANAAEIRFGADPGLGALQALLIALAITGLIAVSYTHLDVYKRQTEASPRKA